jgi:peptidylprolyl isomerase
MTQTALYNAPVVFVPHWEGQRAMRMRLWVAFWLAAAFCGLPPGYFAARAADSANEKEKRIKTGSGLEYLDLKAGNGRPAKRGDLVTVDYTCWLKDGKKIDSSLDRKKPMRFKLGHRMVIPGWEEGLQGMRENGKRKLIIPPRLAYGEKGIESQDGKRLVIPKNATLIYEIELRKLKKGED